MSRPPRVSRGKRLLLKTMELAAWSKQLRGCLNFLSNLQNLEVTEQENWVKGNKKYYLQRCLSLCDNAPKGTEALVKDARTFLATIT